MAEGFRLWVHPQPIHGSRLARGGGAWQGERSVRLHRLVEAPGLAQRELLRSSSHLRGGGEGIKQVQ